MGQLANLSLQTAAVIAGAADQYSQGKSVRAQGDYSASVSDRNALLADAEAADAIVRGGQQEARLRSATNQLIGAEKVSYAGQGVDVNSGSALDVQADSMRLGELDALTMRNNAHREAFGYSVQAATDRSQAAMTRTAAGNQADSLTKGAVSTLLTGGTRVANMWQQNPPTFGRTPSVTPNPLAPPSGWSPSKIAKPKGYGG